jgi:hypothetical protein
MTGVAVLTNITSYAIIISVFTEVGTAQNTTTRQLRLADKTAKGSQK